jgi:demethylphylloquinone reductase
MDATPTASPSIPPDSRKALQARPPHICIVGGGFGGLYTALYLQKYRHLRDQGCQITLVEPRDQFLFTPLLYEVLTQELAAWEIAPTYSSLIAGTNINWQQTSAQTIDLDAQQVGLTNGQTLSYDYLVVALGAQNRPLTIPGVAEHALTFRTLSDALTLQKRLDQLSAAQHPVHVNIIGGGVSGIELATKIADRFSVKRPAQINLIERGDTLMKPMRQGLRQAALKALQKRQVNLYYNTELQSLSHDHLTIRQNHQSQTLPTHLTLWVAGTEPTPWLGQRPILQNDWGQCLTRPTLQLVDYPQVFMLGDSSAPPSPIPNTAQAAYQAADTVAHNLAALTRKRKPKPFRYLHLGDMLTLGKGNAGLWSFGLTLSGKPAALMRHFVYIYRMPTWRHRLKVLKNTLTP